MQVICGSLQPGERAADSRFSTSIGGAAGRAAVPGEDRLGIRDQAQGRLAITQEPGDLFLQANSGRWTWIAASFATKRLGQRGKVFHVRTEENRLAGQDRFDRILAPTRGETLADKDNRGDGIPILQLARACPGEGNRAAMRRAVPASLRKPTFKPEPRRAASEFRPTRST